MTLVLVYRDPNIVSDAVLAQILPGIPEAVAEALTVPGADILTKFSVELWICDRQPGDINVSSLEFIIYAGRHPERLRNLSERRDKIVQAIRVLLHHPERISGYVWILLSDDSFAEF